MITALQSHYPGYTHYAFSVTPEKFQTLSQRIIASGANIFKQNTSEGDSLYLLDPDGHKLEIHIGDWQSRVAIKKQDLVGHERLSSAVNSEVGITGSFAYVFSLETPVLRGY